MMLSMAYMRMSETNESALKRKECIVNCLHVLLVLLKGSGGPKLEHTFKPCPSVVKHLGMGDAVYNTDN